MALFWRTAGLNYVQFSRICANILRNCMKIAPEQREDVLKRGRSTIRMLKWVDGKPIRVAEAEKSN